MQLGLEIFTSRQKAIAHEIETAAPAQLVDFREVPAPIRDLDDEIPF